MNLVTGKLLQNWAAKYKDAAKELRLWATVVESIRWRNFVEVKSVFTDADSVDGYVVFNIRGNRYRMITVIHYAKDDPEITSGHVYLRSLLTHAEYNNRKNWDPFSHDGGRK